MSEVFKNYNGILDLALLQKSTQNNVIWVRRVEHMCIILHNISYCRLFFY